jgi:hypothetical protein
MNYIYDITLNLSKNNLYEFYEWREEDIPEFILKIPVFRVDLETFKDLKYNNISISKEFLLKILEKTEVYTPNSIEIIRYGALFSCDESVLAIEFDSEGNNYMKSNLSIEEEMEVIESVKLIKFTILDYKVKNKNNIKDKLSTRKEIEETEFVLKKLENIYKNKENMKLKYIFYELYNEKIDDIDKIYIKLINIIKNNDNKLSKLNEILKLMNNNEIMSNNS